MKILKNLALTIPLVLVAATGAIAQSNIPTSQQRSPAGFDKHPYRPACEQLSAIPGGAPGWYAWGVSIDGKHQTWKGLKSATKPESVYKTLASLGLCVEGGAIVPLTLSQAQALTDENLTPMDRNIAELKAKADGSYTAGEGSEKDAGDGFGAFMGVVVLIAGAVFLMERFEDEPWVKKLTGNSPKTFDNVPPSFSDMTIPDRINPDDLDDLPNSPKGPRSALDTMKASPFISRAIFGAQRCGKTNLAAIALKSLAAERGVKVFVINLSAIDDNGEPAAYWSSEDFKVVLCDLDSLSDEKLAIGYINQASALIDEFCRHSGPAILLVDEWASMTASHATYLDQLQPLIKKLAGRISILSSSGMQRGKAIWTIAPEMVAETMDTFGKAVKKLSLCLVAIAPNHTEYWNAQEISFSDELLSQIRRNYGGVIDPPSDSDHSRIAFINGQWRELGTYATAKVSAGAGEVGGGGEVGGEVGGGGGGDLPVDAIAPSGLPKLTTTTDNVSGDLKLFLEWLQSKSGEIVTYKNFKNANKLKGISRSRDSFDIFCDKALMLGWLLAEGDELYRVNL